MKRFSDVKDYKHENDHKHWAQVKVNTVEDRILAEIYHWNVKLLMKSSC